MLWCLCPTWTMHFWTFTLNNLAFPASKGIGNIRHPENMIYPALLPDQIFMDKRILHLDFDKPTQPASVKTGGWRDADFFLWILEGGLFWGIRSMNWECCIEYFIDCLLAQCWPAWHAKFPARWRRHVASHQPSHPWGSPAFPVNKLAHSGGVREARAQGHWGWDEEKTHTFFLWRTTHTVLCTVWTPLVKDQWILWNHPVNWNDLKPLF